MINYLTIDISMILGIKLPENGRNKNEL